MAISFVASATDSETATDSTFTLNRPTGLQEDDLLIAGVAFFAGENGSERTITPPTGWTLVRSTFMPDGNTQWNSQMAIMKKTATGSEPASWSGSHDGADTNVKVTFVSAYRGADTAANQFIVEDESTDTTPTTWSTASITNTDSDAWRVTAGAIGHDAGGTPPSGGVGVISSNETAEREQVGERNGSDGIVLAIHDSNATVSEASHSIDWQQDSGTDYDSAGSWIAFIAPASETVEADLDATLGSLQGSFDAEINEADLASTLGSLQGSFDADAKVDADLGATLGPLQSSFDAEINEADLASTLGPLQGSFDADAKVDADIDATLGSLQGSFDGEQNEADLASTLGSLQGSFEADAKVDADVDATLGSLQAAFEGDHSDDVTGDLDATLGPLQGSFDGEQNEADLASTLGSLQGSFDAEINEADIASTLGSLQGSFQADAQVDADVDATLGPLQAAFEGDHGDDNTADLDAALGGLQGSFAADAQVDADVDATLGSLQGSLEAEINEAELAGTLGPLQGSYEGTSDSAFSNWSDPVNGTTEAQFSDWSSPVDGHTALGVALGSTLAPMQGALEGQINEAQAAATLGSLQGDFGASNSVSELAASLRAFNADFNGFLGKGLNITLPEAESSMTGESDYFQKGHVKVIEQETRRYVIEKTDRPHS